VGRGRGGLGAATVVGTMLFSGISGSSTADTAAIGKVTLPSLQRQGYPLPFSAALLAASGASAALIPPTIDLIIIGVVANISIAALFAAGILPALLNGLGLILVILFISRRRGYGAYGDKLSLGEIIMAGIKAIPALAMIVLILGGILGGVFTPTEASVMAVVYGLFTSIVIYRELKVSMIIPMLRSTVMLTGVVMLIIAGSAVLSYALTINQLPQALASHVIATIDNPLVFLLVVQLIFFAISMFMDGLPALLVAMPILVPIARDLGIDPVHFGILVEVNIALGLATPPIGMCLYAACSVTRMPIEKIVRPMLPFVAVLVVTMIIITYAEDISLFLPRLMGLMR
jgi:C4-dicarboxylate transporter DctM subunit